MNITATASVPAETRVDFLILACDDDALADNANANLAALDTLLGGSLRRAIQDERFRGKPGQTLVLHTQERLAAVRLALIGVGPRATLRPAGLLQFAGRAARVAAGVGATSVALVPPPGLAVEPGDLAAALV
jgi:leucyl aminopeptidase